ncbi:MAG: secretin and TonB N-terminal domain-containing protein, partial [Labilithrix sp.]|nr:secretin and TonB N-terminal domain-containing protein [Labilithrix sp.]
MRKRGSIQKRVLQLIGAQAILLSTTFAWADVAPNHVQDVKVRTTDAESGAAEIEVVGTDAPTFNVRVENGGKRLVVDISNSDVIGVKPAITSAVGVVGGVMTQAFKTGAGQMTRLSINLTKQAAYRVRPEGTSLKVTLTPAATTAPASAAPADAEARPAGAELVDVRYERAKAPCSTGCDRIVISTSEMPAYALSTSPSGRVRLELKKTALAKPLARTLDVSQGKGVIKSVTTFYDDKADATFVEIDKGAEGPSQGTISVDGKDLVWSFDAALAKTGPKAPVRRSVTVARESDGGAGPKVETSILGDEPKIEVSSGSEAAGFTATLNAQARGYTGRRIDLDLKDADIHNILRLLADVGRVNIVTADDVSGNVTIRMRNVPWDQALDVVLQAKGLGMVRSGNLIRVAPLATLQ